MSNISQLGTGVGYLYATDPEDTAKIMYSFPNDEQGARSIKALGVQASNIASNLQAWGSITFVAPTGSGSITALSVNGVTQLKTAVSYTVATTAAVLAGLVATEVNGFTPASGANYTALAIDDTVYLFAPATSGDDVNGHLITVSISANLAAPTIVDINGGSDAKAYPYDNRSGFRFFIDVSEDATFGSFTGNEVEISEYVCQRGLETGIPSVAATIADGAIAISRLASIQHVIVDTEGAAGTDNLDNIDPIGFSVGDMIILVGLSAARVTTVTNSGNVVTQGAVSFATGDAANNIILRLGTSGIWYEVAKSTTAVPTTAQFRTANFPFLTSTAYGSTTINPADNTTVTLTANTSTQRQYVTSTATLTTGNYTIAVSTTDAKKGDWFLIQYDAQVTVGSFDVVIGDITLTDADALSGGIVVLAYYNGSAWEYSHFKDFNTYAKVQTPNIATGAVTVATVEDNLKYEVITTDISFESGEEASNKIKMPYSGTVSEIYGIVTKDMVDTGSMVPKNNAGTTMTAGTITFSSGDLIDTAYTSTPSANNTFVAGDILSFATSTSTLGGGKVKLSIKVTRS